MWTVSGTFLSQPPFLYSARNLEMTIRYSLKSRPSEQFHWPEISQIKAEIRINMKFDFHRIVGLQ